jgi:hypothetical protein
MDWLENRLQRFPRLWRLYMALNFCKNQYADGTLKTDGPVFRLFARVFYLNCSCCAALRGILAGLIIGWLWGYLCRL